MDLFFDGGIDNSRYIYGFLGDATYNETAFIHQGEQVNDDGRRNGMDSCIASHYCNY